VALVQIPCRSGCPSGVRDRTEGLWPAALSENTTIATIANRCAIETSFWRLPAPLRNKASGDSNHCADRRAGNRYSPHHAALGQDRQRCKYDSDFKKYLAKMKSQRLPSFELTLRFELPSLLLNLL